MRNGSILAVFILAATFFSPARSQPYLAPPEVELTDKNGVSLLGGSASLTVKLGSVGSGEGTLSYSDYWSSGPVANNLQNLLYFTIAGRAERRTATVTFENSSAAYREDVDPTETIYSYTRLRGGYGGLVRSADGQTYWQNLQDGEVRTYGFLPGEMNPSTYKLLTRVLSNGLIWTYEWQHSNGFYRPISVTNNFGYKVSLVYFNNSVPSYSNPDWFFANEVQFRNLAMSAAPLATAQRSKSTDTVSITTSGGQIWSVSGNPYYDIMTPNALFRIKTPSATTFNSIYRPVKPLLANQNYATSATVNGLTTNYNFTFSSANATGNGTTTVTNPLGGQTIVRLVAYSSPWSSASFPTSTTNELGAITTYVNSAYRITSVTNPEGDQKLYTYNGPVVSSITHKAKPASGLPDLTESATYPSNCTNAVICHRPLTYTDRNGNVSLFEYSSVHGGVLSESMPAGANGIRPVKRYRYAQRTAWILNGVSGYINSLPPVWLKTEERTCRTTVTVNDTCQGGSADEVVTAYDYGPNSGPNNLLLRGIVVTADGQSQRTCFTYDAMGNKISETPPMGTAESCP